jgi:hypothetical protein
METTTTSDPRLMSIPAPLRLALIRILQTRCIADALPSVFHLFVHNGKITSLVFVALYLLFVSIWFPFYLLALAVSEWGVYTILMSAIIFGGRAFIRMIAFPGSNSGVVKEIENEFSKYSVRMLLAASNAIIEVLSVIVPGSSEGSSISRGDVASQWNHALSYKDRVLGVYLESLLYLFRQPPSATHPKVADLTRFGNNKLTGDLGDLSGLTVGIDYLSNDAVRSETSLVSLLTPSYKPGLTEERCSNSYRPLFISWMSLKRAPNLYWSQALESQLLK